MIAVVDYGVGNLHSILGAVQTIEKDAVVTGDASVIEHAAGIILPGVGAFEDAAKKLFTSGLADVIVSCAKSGTPILGVCLGMQLLFEKSYEYGEHTGLSLLKGVVSPIANDLKEAVKVPHMGWNELEISSPCPLTRYISSGDYVYYVHSYYAKDIDSLSAGSEYGGLQIPGIVSQGNVFGCQFHPEKSGNVGLRILKAFCEVTKTC